MSRHLVGLAVVAAFAAAAGTSAAAPPQRFALPDVNLVLLNPCTGHDTLVTLSNRELVIHDGVDAADGAHEQSAVTGDIADSDGFSGRFSITSVSNVRDTSDPLIEGEFRNASAVTMRDGSGRVVRAHMLFHVTIPSGPAGELKGTVDRVMLECVGTPG
jgi:hypothetical protein